MAEERISTELIYEVLKGIQGELGKIGGRLDNIEAEMRIVRQHIAALVQSDMQRGSQRSRCDFAASRTASNSATPDPI